VCSNLRTLLPGEQAIALAGLGLQVTACDPSGGLVQRCEENAAKFGFSKNVRARQSDFLNLTKVCVCVCAWVYVYKYVCVCVCVCVCIYVYVCVCVYIYIHTYAYIQDFSSELGTFDAIITKGSSLPHLHTDNDLRQALKVYMYIYIHTHSHTRG
jgi:hypothetical protein